LTVDLGLGVGDVLVCVVVVVVAVGVSSIYFEGLRGLVLESSMSVHCEQVGTESSVLARFFGGEAFGFARVGDEEESSGCFGFWETRLLLEQYAFRVLCG
jgi:hypothetical protein